MAGPPMEPKPPVVEERPGAPAHEPVERELALRLRQQEVLAELGVLALKGTPLPQLLDDAVRLTAAGLGCELCKVLEYIPSENRLLMCAGVGWDEGLVGTASVGADFDSPSGFALRTGKSVISNQLGNEERFRTPHLLAEHGVRRAINVILEGDGVPFGVLEVDSRSEGEFSERDLTFMQGAANLLGIAIERQRRERALNAALEHQKVLVKEINHRVKNSLQLVAAMLNMQASENKTIAPYLHEASRRIVAIGRAHERLYRGAQIEIIEMPDYLADICQDLMAVTPNCGVVFESHIALSLTVDRAVGVALIVTELVANAAKHAYPDGASCRVFVSLDRRESKWPCLSIRDEGVGLPPDFDVEKMKGLGMRLVSTLAKQIGLRLTVRRQVHGAEFNLEILPSREPE